MNKLTRDEAQKQAKRLMANPILVPQTKDGMTEVINCLMRNCQDGPHCAETMTALLDGSVEFPRDLETTTARLSYAARRLQQPEVAPAGCDRCYLGPDVTTGEIRWYAHVPGERNGYSMAVRCGCERGAWLSDRDRLRAIEATKELATEARSDMQPPAADWARRASGERE